jgi:hypothetical protein
MTQIYKGFEQAYQMTDKYYCDSCKLQLRDKYCYEKHIKCASHLKQKVILSKYCKICDYTSNRCSNFKLHLQTKKHIKAENEYKSNLVKYDCDICGFYTNSKPDYIAHINTKKHIDVVASGRCIPCNQSADENTVVHPSTQMINTSIFMELIKDNKEFQQSMLEFCKNTIQNNMVMSNSHNNSHNTNNTNNNTFNINIFLNETCKDAVNINDFIESLKIDTDVIEHIGREGYVEGMTKIFFDGLGQMQVHHRPIHCTDVKRETFYIRDDNKWTKDKDNRRIVGAINRVIRKNQANLHLWREKNPRYDVMNTAEYEFHLEIMTQCIGGGMDKETSNNRKLIRNLAKLTSIEKTMPEIQMKEEN